MIRHGHLLHPIMATLPAETAENLLARHNVRIEHIISTGQASPVGFWYDQDEDEFVLLLAGIATLRFADEAEARQLRAGDWLDIPAHRRHRVEWTSTTPPAIWLAVFMTPQPKTAG